MIKNYLLITFRSLMKNKVFILINVFGMGIAVACCIVAYLNWEFAAQWDKTQLNAKKIYRVQFWRDFQGTHERYAMAPNPLGNLIKNNFRDVAKTVRYISSYSDVRIGEDIFGTDFAFADSTFFSLFTYKLKYGTIADFYNKSNVFISDELARKYFNKEDVVGKQVTQLILKKDGQRILKEFTVGGVFEKLPLNSSFGFDAITQYDNFWDVNIDSDNSDTSWKRWNITFLQINDPSRVTEVTRQLQQFVEPQNKARQDFKVTAYYLENFDGMMERNRSNPRVNNDWLNGGIPREAITVPAIMAALLLLLACFNFTNTSISISSRRLKEIGLRKVMGGLRSQLVFQFLTENLVLCFLGLLAGMLMAVWLVPAYDSLWPWLELKLNYVDNIGFIGFLTALLLLTALIAGGYPSFYITSFEPVSILKGKTKFGGTNWFTRILLGGQFVISLLGIIMGVAFYNNGVYQKNYDLGFATHGIISTWVNNEGEFNTYRDALSSNKDIELIAGTLHHVGNSWYNDPVKFESIEREADIMEIGDDYFQAMNMTLLSGRNFQKDSETDRKESVLVTEEFVRQFGWKDNAIGKRVVWMDSVQLYVIGVVKNIYARALWNPIEPMMIRYTSPDKYRQVIVKTKVEKLSEVNAFMKKKWKQTFPNSQYNGQFIEQKLEETNEVNKNVVVMFGFLGFFAALMTGIGLFTLVSLNIVKKMKEIGVRKVLGASMGNLAKVINFEFVVNLLIATVIGGALGYVTSDWLMSTIWKYYEKLSLISFALSITLMIVIAVLAVGYKTVTTASLNPTKTLRDE
ncbi:MAG: ABC transporter permease [Bacteroidetes bacterium]|nr:ABC transporter permease [Bacteroidota bacterium]